MATYRWHPTNMGCLVCGTECGTRATPMQYLYREVNGERNDISGFCSVACVERWIKDHPSETQAVPRCVICGGIIINAPWYASFSDERPRHYECTPGAAD